MKPPADALRPVIPDNTCIPRLTAAAGTELADAFHLKYRQIFFLKAPRFTTQ